MHPMQQAFHENHGLQCGYCTPGMVMSAIELVKNNPNPSEQEVREGLEGNICAARLPQYCEVRSGRCSEHGRLNMPDGQNTNGIGAAVKRREDFRFLTGQGRYTDDINRPGQTYAYILRPDQAHATSRLIHLPPLRPMVSSPSLPAMTWKSDRCHVAGRSTQPTAHPCASRHTRHWHKVLCATSVIRLPWLSPKACNRRRMQPNWST